MTAAVPATVQRFLAVPTPQSWVCEAARRLPLLLNDHASCEKKAASAALSLMFRYPSDARLVSRMSRLAREELRHYEQVLALMAQLEIALRPVPPPRYARRLHQACRDKDPGRLVDTLIIGALIEARSCERFAMLVPVLPAPVAAFYTRLLRSEARHFNDYLDFARRCDMRGVDERLRELRQLEGQLVLMPEPLFAFHSGVPTAVSVAKTPAPGRRQSS